MISEKETEVKNNPEPTKTDNRIFHFLLNRHDYWQDRKRLRPDGSFFISNEEIAKYLRIEKHTVIRSKKRLAQIGWIKYRAEPGRGKATFYQLSTTPKTKQPLIKKDVWRSIKALGTQNAYTFYKRGGYSQEEIAKAIES